MVGFKPKKGQVIILTFVFFTVITILSATLFTKTTNFIRRSATSVNEKLAIELADSGIEYALWGLNTGQPLDPVTLSSGEITITFDPSTNTIESKSWVPNQANPKSTRTAKIKLNTLGDSKSSPFTIAVQVDNFWWNTFNWATPGFHFQGIIESNGYEDGKTYSNGGISRLDLNQSHIYGDATAVGLIRPVTFCCGIVVHPPGIKIDSTCCAPVPPLPLPDAQEWYDDIENSATAGGEYTGPCTISSGIVQIGPAKITCGDFLVGGSAVVEITGPIWVENGTFTLIGDAILQVKSTEQYSQVVLVDYNISIGEVWEDAIVEKTNNGTNNLYVMLTSKKPGVDSGMSINVARNFHPGALLFAPEGDIFFSSGSGVPIIIAGQLKMNGASVSFDPQATAAGGAEFETSTQFEIIRGTYQLSK